MIANLSPSTVPSFVADPATGRLAINGAELGDTGTRSVPPGDLLNGWVFGLYGVMQMRRIGMVIYVQAYNLIGDAATSPHFYTLPPGFGTYQNVVFPIVGTPSGIHSVAVYYSGENYRWSSLVSGYSGPGSLIGNGALDVFTPILTREAWPTTLPGVAG